MNRQYPEIARRVIRDNLAVQERLLTDAGTIDCICAIADAIVEGYQTHGKVLVFGNGGSAADAQHIVAELVGRFERDREGLAAIALATNPSILTAIANDYDFCHVFSRQIGALGMEGDIAIGLSTSGNSSNVVAGLRAAEAKGLVTVGLTGQSGGQMKQVTNYCVCVPSDETARIQETHILIGHILAGIVEEELFDSRHE